MKKRIVLLFIISLFIGFICFACNKEKTNEPKEKTKIVNDDKEIIESAYNKVVSFIPIDITENLTLITSYGEVSFKYSSSNVDALSNDGVINRGENDVFVTLTITCSLNDTVINKEYTVIIRKAESQPAEYNIDTDKNMAKDLINDAFNYIDISLYSDEEINNLNSLIETKIKLIDEAKTINEINEIIESFYQEFDELYNDFDKYVINAKESILEYLNNLDKTELELDEINQLNNLYDEYLELIDLQDTVSEVLQTVSEFKNAIDLLYNSFVKPTKPLIDVELPDYYDMMDKTLVGSALKQELRSLITATHTYKTTYDEIRYKTAKSDADPNVSGNIITIYSRKSVRATWDGGNTWNREHVWPQSTGWFTTSGAGSDLHHLRPETPSVNSSRGNKAFGPTITSTHYYPGDEAKGDVARIIFYLLTRYPESDKYSVTAVAKSMDLLLQWNEEDPVDNLERNRNEVVFGIQGNRNPFIDYAGFANLIWGKIELAFNGEIDIIHIEINYCILEDLHKNYYEI